MTAILDGDDGDTESLLPVENAVGALIVESDTERFGEDVINASNQVPIIVDFWAPWCGPCKQMTPILEKLVLEYAGKVRLVKINIDDNQALAKKLQVQSIPMVYAFKDGRPVDAFNGALPESQLKKFIEKITGGEGSPIDQAIEEANNLLEGGDPTRAKEIFNHILMSGNSNPEAHLGVLKCLMADNEIDQARSYLVGLTEELLTNPLIRAVQTSLELKEQTAEIGNIDSLKTAVESHPNNHQGRYDYALALYGVGEIEGSIEELVEIIKRNRKWNNDAARQQLFKIFEALGHSDPLTVEGRRKMSTVLFS
jgi:putative thioredoxin